MHSRPKSCRLICSPFTTAMICNVLDDGSPPVLLTAEVGCTDCGGGNVCGPAGRDATAAGPCDPFCGSCCKPAFGADCCGACGCPLMGRVGAPGAPARITGAW